MNPAFLSRRLLYGIVSLLILSLIIFVCTHVLPGDAASAILGEQATPEALSALRARLGLDRPLAIQYLSWLIGIAHGDFGVSTTLNQPVVAVIAGPFANSLLLAGVSLATASLIAIPLGVAAAVRRGSRADATILTGSYLGV